MAQPEVPPADPAAAKPRPAPRRPGTLIAGCVMTWVGGVSGILGGLSYLVAAGSEDAIEDFSSDTVTADEAQTLLQTIGSLILVWSLIAVVLALFVFFGRRWAALALAVVGGLFTVLSLVSVPSSGVQALVGAAWVIAACALILNGSREWFRYRARVRTR